MPWLVGGLEPFLDLAGASPKAPLRPLSFWIALLGLICGIVALAQPLRETRTPVLIWDASFSHSGGGTPDHIGARPLSDAGHAMDWKRYSVGRIEEASGAPELLRAIRALKGRQAAVLTDLPKPTGLPPWVDWFATPPIERNVAILNMLPHPDGGWELHWRAWGDYEEVALYEGKTLAQKLAGAQGILWLEQAHSGQTWSLRTLEGTSFVDQPLWDDVWETKLPSFQIPSGAHPAWEAAFHALVPRAHVERGHSATGRLRNEIIQVAFSKSPLEEESGKLVFAEDIFSKLPELEALALLNKKVYENRSFLPPARPLGECGPTPLPTDWSSELWGSPLRETWGRLLAGMGLSLYLLSLLLKKFKA
ncbi:MAG TPA: hypothetical protein QGG59_00020 [Planctomycetota bacterium]|nr:hypothetical protein [Planctomycetota bacterium]HJM38480.1 hypothetical protein [Planctomycetota bacterium]